MVRYFRFIFIGLSILIMGAAFIFPTIVQACSCVPPAPAREASAQVDAVFTGRVTEIEENGGIVSSSADPLKVTFMVQEAWKGVSENTIHLYTAMSSASCGYPFVRGQEYIVYAYSSDDGLSTGLCTRTALLSEASDDLGALGPGTDMRNLASTTSSVPGGPISASRILYIIGVFFIVFAALVIYHRKRNS